MEVNCIPKPLFVSESSGTDLHGFDARVHALGMAVVHAQYHRVENAPQVLAQGFGGLLHRLETTAGHPVDQALPALVCPGPAAVFPQSCGEFLDRPGARRLQ